MTNILDGYHLLFCIFQIKMPQLEDDYSLYWEQSIQFYLRILFQNELLLFRLISANPDVIRMIINIFFNIFIFDMKRNIDKRMLVKERF